MIKNVCRLLVFLCALLSLSLLAACTANPSASAPIQDTEPPLDHVIPSTSVVEPTATLTETEQWEDDSLRAQLPKPAADNYAYGAGEEEKNGRIIWLAGVNKEGILSYIETIRKMGFNTYEEWEGSAEEEAFVFWGKSADGVVVSVNYMFYDEYPYFADKKEGYQANIWIIDRWKDLKSVPSNIEDSRKPWGSNLYEAQLPEPQVPYSSAVEYPAEDINGARYVVLMEYMNFMDIDTYIQALRDNGFTIHETSEFRPFADRYQFDASNEQGYTVLFTLGTVTNTGNRVCVLILYAPGEGGHTEWTDNWYRELFPEPDAVNWSQQNARWSYDAESKVIISLEGMDYEAIKAYAKVLQDSGSNIDVKVEDDPDEKRYSFAAWGDFKFMNDADGKYYVRTLMIRLVCEAEVANTTPVYRLEISKDASAWDDIPGLKP